MSWTPEQKAAQSAKMKAYWAAKKAEAGEQVPASLPAIQPAPVLEPQLSDKPLNKVTLVEIDEDAELEAAYKDIVSRKGFSANLARYQMQELLEDSVTVPWPRNWGCLFTFSDWCSTHTQPSSHPGLANRKPSGLPL